MKAKGRSSFGKVSGSHQQSLFHWSSSRLQGPSGPLAPHHRAPWETVGARAVAPRSVGRPLNECGRAPLSELPERATALSHTLLLLAVLVLSVVIRSLLVSRVTEPSFRAVLQSYARHKQYDYRAVSLAAYNVSRHCPCDVLGSPFTMLRLFTDNLPIVRWWQRQSLDTLFYFSCNECCACSCRTPTSC